MTFIGIPTAALDFYEDLEEDNSKTFWAANKDKYDQAVKIPMTELATALAPEFGEGKLFRPFRDVRFAKDKTPYKTHQGIWFDESKMYVQVSAAGLWVAGGYWRTGSDQITRYRAAIDNDLHATALEAIISDLAKVKFEVGGDQLTKVPAGFAKEHPRAQLLRYKTLTARRDFKFPAWMQTPKAKNEIAKAWRTIAPLVDWLQQHVGASDLPSR